MTYLSFYAETAIHVGVGHEMGPVDLPIHRERHTGLPFVPGHGLKGALRASAEVEAGSDNKKQQDVGRVFGTDSKQGELVVGEALPVAIPFRSLDDVFVWATCPLLLNRFSSRTGVPVSYRTPPSGRVVTATGAPAGAIVIEDLAFDREAGTHSLDVSPYLMYETRGISSVQPPLRQVVVLHDSDFRWLAEHCLPVVARVQLTAGKTTGEWVNPLAPPLPDGTPKTEKGNLWSEELLPPDTILYAAVGQTGRAGSSALAALSALVQRKPVVQLGGNETVGLGWCWMKFHNASGAPHGGTQ